MTAFWKKYFALRQRNACIAWDRAKHMKFCYAFLAPYALLFLTFYILPMLISIYYSFTYNNILEPARFIGMDNYITLILKDDVFLTAVKNTFLLAVITGPVGYIMSFCFAWLINELPRWVRTIAVVIFYAPSIAGNAYYIFSIIFRGDAYGYLNAILMKLGILNAPILWLTTPDYIMPVIIIVTLWMSMSTGFLSFVAGLQGVDRSQYEAGYVDGIRNRWQELRYITLPSMSHMLLFSAVMQIQASFSVSAIAVTLAGYPSKGNAVDTVVSLMSDVATVRYEFGYASAIAVVLFMMMVITRLIVGKILQMAQK